MNGFYEFFAGGGMVRVGLGANWRCLFANDFDARKAAAYRANFDGGALCVEDIRKLRACDLPGHADLAWGSFPCQDLSLAGLGAGLGGARSGTFHAFWRLIEGLAAEGRAPALVALENVCGTLTSHGGRDFRAICARFAEGGYRLGALVIDAALFIPQSRPRLFLIGVREDLAVPAALVGGPDEPFRPPALRRSIAALPAPLREAMIDWRLEAPAPRNISLAGIVEAGAQWDASKRTGALLAMMSERHRDKLRAAGRHDGQALGVAFRRTRPVRGGGRAQRAEARFDGLAGCLRTPAGGSSRQTLLGVEGETVRSRLLTPRETARLMGLPDEYRLPARRTEAYHLTGDGVVVDVVRYLAERLFEPMLAAQTVEFARGPANMRAG